MKKILFLAISLFCSHHLFAVTIVNSPSSDPYRPNNPDQWINTYFKNGYTVDHDVYYIGYCNNRLNAMTPPAGHTLFKKLAYANTIRRREDPYGRGYYLDKMITCQGTFINANDCVDQGHAFNPGEFTFTSETDYMYCVERTTFYQCQSGQWNYHRTEEVLLPNCIMP